MTSIQVNFAPRRLLCHHRRRHERNGSYANPTAPPGKFCIYMGSIAGIDDVAGYSFNEPALDDRGVYFAWDFTGGATAVQLLRFLGLHRTGDPRQPLGHRARD